MNRMNDVFFIVMLLILNGCAGAHVNIPVGPITIGTDVSTFGNSNDHDSDEATSDESEHRDERE